MAGFAKRIQPPESRGLLYRPAGRASGPYRPPTGRL